MEISCARCVQSAPQASRSRDVGAGSLARPLNNCLNIAWSRNSIIFYCVGHFFSYFKRSVGSRSLKRGARAERNPILMAQSRWCVYTDKALEMRLFVVCGVHDSCPRAVND